MLLAAIVSLSWFIGAGDYSAPARKSPRSESGFMSNNPAYFSDWLMGPPCPRAVISPQGAVFGMGDTGSSNAVPALPGTCVLWDHCDDVHHPRGDDGL